MTSAPTGKSGRFSRALGVVRGIIIFYVLLYALMVIGGYGWFKTRTIETPQGAAFALSTSPLGLALDVPAIKADLGDRRPLALTNVRHVWPVLTPWRMVTVAETAALQIPNQTDHDQIDMMQLRAESTLALPLAIETTLSAGSLDWRIVLHSVKAEGEEDPDATTMVAPRLVYRHNFLASLLGLGGAAQTLDFAAAPVMLPSRAMSAVVQIDNLRFRLLATRALPDDTSNAAVKAWHQSGGRISLEDFNMSVIGMDLMMAGDVGLSDALDVEGNMQMQLSGLGDGYTRLGQLNIVPVQHYRLLGYLLQAMPDKAQQVFSMPVKIQKNKVYIGPAAAFSLGLLPWQSMTDVLLATPVGGAKADAPPVVEPQALAPLNTVSVPVAPEAKPAQAPTPSAPVQ